VHVVTGPSPTLAGVLFDLDGVIVDTARLHYAAWKRLADSLSVHFDETLNRALKGIDRLGSLDRLLGARARGLGASEKQSLSELKNRWYVESLQAIGPDDVLPGARRVLEEVRGAGHRIALVSASRNAMTVLARLELEGCFDCIVDPAAVSRGKPAPDIFLAATRQLGLKPAQCLGFEDAAAGIAGLKAAGMVAIGVGEPAELEQADWVLPDLTHFRLDVYRGAA
jgi:beta-phosphoglucomutase